MWKKELFLELAQPNEIWISARVSIDKFIWRYVDLKFGNWASRARKESSLAKMYIVEFDKSITTWRSIDRIRLNGFQVEDIWSQHIRWDIKRYYKSKRCIVLWTSWTINKPIEVDHKNGRKNDLRVMNTKTQKVSDFQPLSKAANDAKRQHCKNCKKTCLRFDAKKLWYNISYTQWSEKHSEKPDGCIWCFWYDPIEFRKKFWN